MSISGEEQLMTTSALSAQQYSDAKQLPSAAIAVAPELRSCLNRARLALMNLGQVDLNGYKPSLKLIRYCVPKSEIEGRIDTMFAWLAHGLRIANGIGDRALQQEILDTVSQYEGQDLYLAYHLIQHNTLSMRGHTITTHLQNWLLGVIQHTAATAEIAVDLLRLSKIVHRFGLDIPYNQIFDASRRPPVFFSHDYVQDVLLVLRQRPTEIDAHVMPSDQVELDDLYAMQQMLQRYLRHCGVGVNLFLADTQNKWDSWIYCYLNDDGQVHELWCDGAGTPFPHLIRFLRQVLQSDLPASFNWDENGLTKTFVAVPDINPNYFNFQLIADVEGSNTHQVLINAIYDRFEFVSSVYAGLQLTCHLPSEKLATLKQMLAHFQNVRW